MRAIVLAAGKGTYVLKSPDFLDKKDICVVVGYKREKVPEAFHGYDFVMQEDSFPYGRIVRDENGKYVGVVAKKKTARPSKDLERCAKYIK